MTILTGPAPEVVSPQPKRWVCPRCHDEECDNCTPLGECACCHREDPVDEMELVGTSLLCKHCMFYEVGL